jgi:hypothetical protein
MTRTAKTPVTRSSGNLFEDLQVPAPSEALAKSELAAIIAVALQAQRLTQTAAAHLRPRPWRRQAPSSPGGPRPLATCRRLVRPS